LDIGAPARRRHLPGSGAAGGEGEAEGLQNLALLLAGDGAAAERFDSRRAIADGARAFGERARRGDFARLAAAELENELGRDIDAPGRGFRIDAALEAIARIGEDAELASGS